MALAVLVAVGFGGSSPHHAPGIGRGVPDLANRGSVPIPGRNAPLGSPPTVSGASYLATGPTHDNPTIVITDLANGYLYITNFGSIYLGGNTLSVVDPTSLTTLATLPIGDDPIGGVYDPADQYVYACNFGITSNLSVVKGTSVVGSIPTGPSPHWAIYNPVDQEVYAASTGANNVSVVQGLSVIASVAVGNNPQQLVFDPVDREVYVANAGSGNVSVINGTKNVATIAVGSTPEGIAVDPTDGWIYVTNTGSDNVSVINGTTVIANVAVGLTPGFEAFDAADGEIYVADSGSNSVHVLNGTHAVANLSVGGDPDGVTYDNATGEIYVADWITDDIAVVNGSRVVARIAAGLSPYTADYDPLTGEVAVPNYDNFTFSLVGTPPSPANLTVTETGLPGGTDWQLELGLTNYSVFGGTELLRVADGSYPYAVAPIPGYIAANAPGTVTVTGSGATLTIHFAPAYDLSFDESGLVPGTLWNVTVRNATGVTTVVAGTGPDHVLEVANGSYTYTPEILAGYFGPSAGSTAISGSSRSVNLTYTAVTFPVDFEESGLILGTPWSVLLNGVPYASTNGSVDLRVPNGSYSYSVPTLAHFAPRSPSGEIVVNDSPTTVDLAFNETFSVTFGEVGLPPGTEWSVVLGGDANRSTGSTSGFVEPNGTYAFTVSAAGNGNPPNISSGLVRVDGSAAFVPINYTNAPPNATPYPVRFDEFGLPVGTAWNVTLSDLEVSGSAAELSIFEGNGSFRYSIQSAGYRATPGYGSVTVLGAPLAPVVVNFTRVPEVNFPVSFVPSGLLVGVPWQVSVNGSTWDAVGGSSINVSLPTGSYPYAVAGAAGYAYRHNGTALVGEGPVQVPVAFERITYDVTFQESGLTAGAVWRVAIGNLTNASNSARLTLEEPNGSYGYAVDAIAGYATPARGSVTVAGSAPGVVDVIFLPGGTPSGNATGTGTSSPAFFEDAGAAAAAAGLGAVAILLLVRRRGGPPTPPTSDASPSPDTDAVDDGS